MMSLMRLCERDRGGREIERERERERANSRKQVMNGQK